MITREQAEAWAGRKLTDDEAKLLEECIPNSTIPEAISEIVSGWEELR